MIPRVPLPVSNGERILFLAHSLPTLHEAQAGGKPILPTYPVEDPVPWLERLDRWAMGEASRGGELAAALVFCVWNGGRGFETPRFDLASAIGTWDETHRRAFAAWARGGCWSC